MNYILYYGLMIVGALIGMVAFSQILGAFRSRKEQPLWKLIFTAFIWSICLAALTFLAWWFLTDFYTATLFGYLFGLIILIFFKHK